MAKRNCPTSDRLHRRPSLDNHPGYINGQFGPLDPPTGTPRNGSRRYRVAASPEFNPTGDDLPATQEKQITNPSTLATPSAPAPSRPHFHVDPADDEHFELPPTSPTPAQPSSKNMNSVRGIFSRRSPSSRDDRSDSIQVPETPDPRELANHHRDIREWAGDAEDADTPATNNRIDHHRAVTLDEMTERLKAQTALTDSVRARAFDAQLGVIHQRKVAVDALQARDRAEHRRATAESRAAEAAASIIVERDRKTNSNYTIACILFGVLLYVWWCWYNAPDFRCIRETGERFYELRK